MAKKITILIIAALILLIGISTAAADKVEKDDVEIIADDTESEMLFFANKDDKVEFKVKSDIPVNAYIITSDYYSDATWNKDFSKAKLSKVGITDSSFSYKIPDDQSYYFIIYNPNNSTATVSYEYTDLFEKRVEEAGVFFGMGLAICVGIVIIGVVILVLIIYLITREKPQPYYPPYQQQYPPYPPQQPPPPSQQGQKPPEPPINK